MKQLEEDDKRYAAEQEVALEKRATTDTSLLTGESDAAELPPRDIVVSVNQDNVSLTSSGAPKGNAERNDEEAAAEEARRAAFYNSYSIYS